MFTIFKDLRLLFYLFILAKMDKLLHIKLYSHWLSYDTHIMKLIENITRCKSIPTRRFFHYYNYFYTVVLLAIFVRFLYKNSSRDACAYVIERLVNTYMHMARKAHFKFPIIDNVINKISLMVLIPELYSWRITYLFAWDQLYLQRAWPKLIHTGVENPIVYSQNLFNHSEVSSVEWSFDTTLSSREQINEDMEVILDKATDSWGPRSTE